MPVLRWIKENYPVDFVDVITEAGMDGVLSGQEDIREVLRSITISVDINKSRKLFVVGHHDCRGNPVDQQTHHQQIQAAAARLKNHWSGHEVVGLWVNQNWKIEVIVSK
ncbi:MAG: hypothetical protein HY592_05830 [Candidatus Omnitrophica bacterium]|nr:hypothetical protein [Candidatus Omnitrophota bacterium]